MISILLTAWKEERTIGKCIETLMNGFSGEFELILGCPDEGTYNAAMVKATEMGIQDRIILFRDEGKGKPRALNEMMQRARGEFWVFGDGDVYFGENVINKLLAAFADPQVMAVTGRPRSADSKSTMMGYFGNLLADAAHHKRTIDLTENPQGRGKLFVKKRPFFPVSGYLHAMRSTTIRLADDTLVDDAYLSYEVHRQGGKIAYVPDAEVFVHYPTTLSDYFKQKKRSVGGYLQLWKYGFVTKQTNTRSFWRELEYFWFPLTYAKNLRELLWSLALYPIRTYLWLVIFWERRIRNKSFERTWVRIESTK